MTVTSVVRASERSFQVKWTESLFERGSLADTSRWTAILTVRVRTPATAEALRRNPLGVLVDAIDWAREVDVAPPSPAPVPAAVARVAPSIPSGSPLDPDLDQTSPLSERLDR